MATQEQIDKGLEVLRSLLKRMRDDQQGGYTSLHKGVWQFTSTGIGQVEPAELDALFAAVDIVPDEVVPKGSCDACAFSVGPEAHDRGWSRPCSGCPRPSMGNFVPAKHLVHRENQTECEICHTLIVDYDRARHWFGGTCSDACSEKMRVKARAERAARVG